LIKPLLYAFSILSFLGLPKAGAQNQCLEIFSNHPTLGTLEPVAQLMYWEQIANLPEMRKPNASVKVNFSSSPNSKVDILKIENASVALDYFSKKDKVSWPHHPLNTDSSVPFFEDKITSTSSLFYSASASLFLYIHNDLFSIKPPTDTPHPLGPKQPSKAQRADRTKLSVKRSQTIKDIDEALGRSEYLQVLYDVAAYTDRDTNNGYSVRDLTPLQDGHYYLTAFSIPYVGQEILAHLKSQESFQTFWGKHYAAALGRAKALFLLRYGLQMNTPNAQNIIVQLDRNFFPTGKIFLRDTADSRYYEAIAYALELKDPVRWDNVNGIEHRQLLRLETETSFWQMDRGGVALETLELWKDLHDKAFVQTVLGELQLSPEKYKTTYDIQSFFATDGGIAIINAYAKARM
jgi:hypothetical protein